MPSHSDAVGTNLPQFVVRSVLLAVGTSCVVVGIRDLLLYLDSYDLSMVGTTNSLLQVEFLLVVGWFCVLVGLTNALSASTEATPAE